MSQAVFDKPRASTAGDVGSEGTASAYARADHKHDRSGDAGTASLFKKDTFTLAGTTGTWALTYVPVTDSLHIYNGAAVLVEGTDYTLSGQTVSILGGGISGDGLVARYAYSSVIPEEEIPTGLLLWLRATDLGGVDNSTVTIWEDQSGNSNNGTGTGTSGAKPVLKTGQTPAGGPAVYIDSTSNSRHVSFANFLTGTVKAEVFVVVRAVNDPAPSSSGESNGFWKFGAQGGSNDACHFPYSDSNIYDDFGSTTRQNVGNPSADLENWHIYNALTQSNLWEARLDGTLLYTSPGSVVGWSTTPVLGITPKSGSLTENGKFYIAELMIFGTVLTGTERTAQLNDLADRHGITV